MNDSLNITGRHQTYKERTTRITEHLARTASTCCDLTQILSSLRNERNRKIAEVGGLVPVQTGELILLAKAIADSDDAWAIPHRVLQLILKTIDGRQGVSDDITATHAFLTADDLTHLHFINVLREVYVILEAASHRPAPSDSTFEPMEKSKGKSKQKAVHQSHINAFASLTIEEPTKSTNVASKALGKIDLSKAKFSLLSAEIEAQNFKLLCHLRDMHDLRVFAQNAWLQYNKGEVSLMYASMATEAAISLLKCADAAFVSINPTLETFEDVLKSMGLQECTCEPQKTIHLCKAEDSAASNLVHDVTDLICWPGAETIMIFVKSWDPNFSEHERFARKVTATLGNHPAIATLVSNPVLYGVLASLADEVRHEIIVGLDFARTQDSRPMWLCIALQMLLDIAEIAPMNIEAGISQLQAILETVHPISQSMSALFIDAAKSERHEFYLGKLQKFAESSKKALQLLDHGQVTTQLQPSMRWAKKFGKDLAEARNHFANGSEKLIPGLAGTKVHYACMIKSVSGCRTLNLDGLLIGMAFQYRAAKYYGLLGDWPDMELFIESQSKPNHPLVPRMKPRCRASEWKVNYETVFGAHLDKKRPRMIKTGNGHSIEFPEGFTECSIRKNDQFRVAKDKVTPSKPMQVALHELRSAQLETESGARQDFTAVELLDTFKEAFIKDEPYLNFDWLGLYLACSQISSDISLAAKDQLPELGFSWDLIEGKSAALSMLVMIDIGFIDSIRSPIDKRLLAKAAKVMASYIKDHGSDFSKSALEHSSGHIPERLRPAPFQSDFETNAVKVRQSLESLSPGISLARSCGVTVLHHPKLTKADVETGPKRNGLPPYLWRAQEEGKDDAEKN